MALSEAVEVVAVLVPLIGPPITVWVGFTLNRKVKVVSGHASEAVAQATNAATDAKGARDQVQNSHTTNFRDDLDSLRREMSSSFGSLRKDVGSTRDDLRGLHKDISGVRQDVADVRSAQSTGRREVQRLAESFRQHVMGGPA